jgi:hypothetical protein
MDLRTIPIYPALTGSATGPNMGQPALSQYFHTSSNEYEWWLNHQHWQFSFGSYSRVLLRRLAYVLDGLGTLPDGTPTDAVSHYYRPKHVGAFSGPLTPSWTSVAVTYEGISDLVQLHNIDRHPSADREWRLSLIHYPSQVFHPGPDLGQLNNVLCLFLWNVPQNELADPNLLWYLPNNRSTSGRLYLPRKPLTLDSVSGDNEPLTITPV